MARKKSLHERCTHTQPYALLFLLPAFFRMVLFWISLALAAPRSVERCHSTLGGAVSFRICRGFVSLTILNFAPGNATPETVWALPEVRGTKVRVHRLADTWSLKRRGGHPWGTHAASCVSLANRNSRLLQERYISVDLQFHLAKKFPTTLIW